jgi:hypothetical protein
VSGRAREEELVAERGDAGDVNVVVLGKALVVEVDWYFCGGAASADVRTGTSLACKACSLLLDRDGHVD